jgi:hypothetical protein
MTAIQSESVNARKTRWHQSTLSSLLDGCSWQYFLTYVLEQDQGLKPYATVGTAFHSAVELHELNRMKDIVTTEKEMLDEVTKTITEVITEEELRTELLLLVRAAVRNWYEFHRPVVLNWEVIAIEPEFTLPLVDNARPIGGYIDAIYRDPNNGEIFVVDHKTAKDFTRWKSEEGHRHQAAMYSAALVLSEDFPDIVELPKMVYMVTRTTRSSRKGFESATIVEVQPDLEDIKQLGERIRMAEDIVEKENYVKKPEWFLCSTKWCPFYEGCMVTEELSGTVSKVKLKVLENNDHGKAQSDITNNTTKGDTK